MLTGRAFFTRTAGLVTLGDAAEPVITIYKSKSCGCCGKWVDHYKASGFQKAGRHVLRATTLRGEVDSVTIEVN